MFNICFDSAQEKRLQDQVHLLDQILLHLILQEFLGSFLVLEVTKVEPRLELLPIGEDGRKQEVQK